NEAVARELIPLALACALLPACGSARPRQPQAPSLKTELVATIGGSDREMVRDVAFDRTGNLYLAGNTRSADFPTTPASTGPEFLGVNDAFVVKLDPAGAVVWSRFLGSLGWDRIYGMEIGPDGSIYVTGRAGTGMAVTPGMPPRGLAGYHDPAGTEEHQDGFICRLDAADGAVIFCTYFGNPYHIPIRDIAIDSMGDIFIVTSAATGTFPREWFENAFQPERRGNRDLLLVKVRGDGSAVEWATWLGGSDEEGNTNTVRVDRSGVYVAMWTRSGDLPTAGFGQNLHGTSDVYAAKLSLDGSRLIWGNYIGGSGYESNETHQLAVAPNGTVYVTGPTTSPDYPVTPGAWQTEAGSSGEGAPDAFLAAISPDGSRLLASTRLGGSGSDWAEGIDVDSRGRVYVTGGTKSDDFPGLTAALGRDDLWVAVLTPELDRLVGAARIGGSGRERGRSMAVGPSGRFAAGGHSESESGRALLRQRPAATHGQEAFVAVFSPVP
ncbi:MAG: SBBP repeat-containing protein, partial [Gemmatimonadales bacterium]